MPDQPPRYSWRTRLRLSVRGLIILVLLVGIWPGWLVRGARIQREAVAEIEKTAGGVRYHWEWRNDRYDPSGQLWAPKWLVNRLGIDYFDHVAAVGLKGLGPDRLMIEIEHFDRLEALELVGEPLSDAGLAHVRRLTKLKDLDLGWTKITDAGLAHLRGRSALKRLRLAATGVTDAGLAHLKGLTRLQHLDLDETNIGDAGLTHLKGMISLRALSLRKTHVTEAGVRRLQEMLPNLKISTNETAPIYY